MGKLLIVKIIIFFVMTLIENVRDLLKEEGATNVPDMLEIFELKYSRRVNIGSLYAVIDKLYRDGEINFFCKRVSDSGEHELRHYYMRR